MCQDSSTCERDWFVEDWLMYIQSGGLRFTYKFGLAIAVSTSLFALSGFNIMEVAENKDQQTEEMPKVRGSSYFNNYNGIKIPDLERVYNGLRQQGYKQFVYFAGDSSLDNKYWLLQQPRVQAVQGYQNILDPPVSVPDVCYWLNKQFADHQQTDQAAIMTAVEATTLGERSTDILEQDEFVRDHIGSEDTLIVSIGGNDIALTPSNTTIKHLISLIMLPACSIYYNPSFWYFVRMFKDDIEKYLLRLTEKNTPKQILVCMIYFPCESADSASWSQSLLNKTGYDRNPGHLQTLIRMVYKYATQKITLPGRNCRIVPVPLFDILDASNPEHYVARVEPSTEGGRLMANHFYSVLSSSATSAPTTVSPPSVQPR